MRPALRYSLLALIAVILTAAGFWLARPDSAAPPPDVLALHADNGARLVAAPGPGFHYLETHASHRWAWSAGEATLLLRRTGPRQTVRLRFQLQSLSPRTVTVSAGGFILWRGRLERGKTPVDIPALTLTSPEVALTLTSDLPGDAKPGDGRKLAFAVYDLEISPAD